jgi:hypothetical protein
MSRKDGSDRAELDASGDSPHPNQLGQGIDIADLLWHSKPVMRRPAGIAMLLVAALLLGWILFEIWFGVTQAR